MEPIIRTWFTDKQKMHASILRDLLVEIFRRRPKSLVFKGGTAISFFYGSDRFSEDIDFSMDCLEDYATIDGALESFEDTYGYIIVNDWESEISQVSGLFRRYYLTFRYTGSETIDAEIDCSTDTCRLEPLKKELNNYYYPAVADTMDPEEILAEKVAALYTRRKARDLYDIYYLTAVMDVRINMNLISDKLREGPEPSRRAYSFNAFKERVEGLSGYWKELDGILNNFATLGFDKVSKGVLDRFRNV